MKDQAGWFEDEALATLDPDEIVAFDDEEGDWEDGDDWDDEEDWDEEDDEDWDEDDDEEDEDWDEEEDWEDDEDHSARRRGPFRGSD